MNREELRRKFSGRLERLRLDEFDCDIHVCRLSALAHAKMADRWAIFRNSERANSAEAAIIEVQCRIVAEGLVDQHGTKIYREDELEAIATDFPSAVLEKICNRILEISGLKEAGPENLAKNSLPTPGAASLSA